MIIQIEEEVEDLISAMFTFFVSTGQTIEQVPEDDLVKLFHLLQREIIRRNGTLH
tara:strand:- start:4 stop:168 length:165 start_codon:yes stop_codon:yes gene_type:complete